MNAGLKFFTPEVRTTDSGYAELKSCSIYRSSSATRNQNLFHCLDSTHSPLRLTVRLPQWCLFSYLTLDVVPLFTLSNTPLIPAHESLPNPPEIVEFVGFPSSGTT